MLTKQRLQRIAQRHGTGLQAQERDYVQHLFLSVLYARSQALLFKGGTALRVVHRSPRYSEDLDFNTTPGLADTQNRFQQAITDLTRFGIVATRRNEWESPVGYSFDLTFPHHRAFPGAPLCREGARVACSWKSAGRL
ncbi:MAG: nucleotidyl transferase AbiEii/AbiGii toxin family protein [Chloroflexota bacterium]